MSRKLASIKRIDELITIEGADKIELAIIGGWQVVVQKSEHTVGDLVCYLEVDSFLPMEEQYEFLRKSSFRTRWDGVEGFRLKTIRLRGQLSQGLVLPMETVHKAWDKFLDTYGEHFKEQVDVEEFAEGENVTELLGISKWDTPQAGVYQGQGKGGLPLNAKGYFPGWLPKTDEERIQNCWNVLPKGIAYVETEKLHGTSATFYLKDGVFGICSRNLDLKVEEGGLYAEMANELGLEQKLRDYVGTTEGESFGYALQGEIIGEGINNNYYNIPRRRFFVFNVFDESCNGYLTHDNAVHDTAALGLDFVPVITTDYKLPATCAQALLNAEGPATVGNQPIREGSVIRHSLPLGRRISTKIISNKYAEREA